MSTAERETGLELATLCLESDAARIFLTGSSRALPIQPATSAAIRHTNRVGSLKAEADTVKWGCCRTRLNI
jgi:hypothetical protein